MYSEKIAVDELKQLVEQMEFLKNSPMKMKSMSISLSGGGSAKISFDNSGEVQAQFLTSTNSSNYFSR